VPVNSSFLLAECYVRPERPPSRYVTEMFHILLSYDGDRRSVLDQIFVTAFALWDVTFGRGSSGRDGQRGRAPRLAPPIECRDPLTSRQRHNLGALGQKERI
jgi:hypothetical protein